MIRQAQQSDITKIMQLVKQSVQVMNETGNYQWDDTYPLASDYQEDLYANELFVYQENEQLVGVCTISEKEYSEYPEISWSLPDKSIVLKRLAVSPVARGRGIGDALFKYAEQVAKEKGLTYIKVDTFGKNIAAQRLFQRKGYTFVEKRFVEEKQDYLFYYEKSLKN